MSNNKNNTSYENVLKDTSKNKEKSVLFDFSKTYPAYIILAVTLAISYFAYNFIDNKVKDDNSAAFEKATIAVTTRFEKKIELNESILSSMQGLFQRSFVVSDVFQLNGSIPVSSYKSLLSIDYAFKVKENGINDFIHNAKSSGNYDIVIHPEGKRDIYYIIDYIVPFNLNVQRTGFDFASDKLSKIAIEKARDENKFTSTIFHNIRENIEGFYLIAPTYLKDSKTNTLEERKSNFEGAIVIEINKELFFEETIGKGISSDSTIIFEIYDKLANGDTQKVFSSKNSNLMDPNVAPLLNEDKSIKLADRDLLIKFQTIPDFGGKFQNYLPLITLSGAVITSFVLFAFIVSVITSRARALDLAEKMTRSQRRIVDTSKDVISVLDFAGNWKTMNNASIEVFGYEPNDMIGKNIESLFANEKDFANFISLIETSKEEETKRFDYQMIKGNRAKDIVWIGWSFTYSLQDKLIYSIGRDVTLEKIAEEQSKLRTKQIQLAEQFAREASESKTYFLTKLGHQLRNSLTGIIGYLQLVQGKAYENEEELEMFVNMSAESSEELYTFVSDLIDNAEQSEEAIRIKIATLNFDNIIKITKEKVKTESNTNFEIIVNNESNTKLVGDENIVVEAMLKVFEAMSGEKDTCRLEITAQENHSEGATEIQILAEANPMVENMIKIYKENKLHIIDALQYDKNNIIMDLSIVESNIRRLNGTMLVDTLGKDGNFITLTLPLQHA